MLPLTHRIAITTLPKPEMIRQATHNSLYTKVNMATFPVKPKKKLHTAPLLLPAKKKNIVLTPATHKEPRGGGDNN